MVKQVCFVAPLTRSFALFVREYHQNPVKITPANNMSFNYIPVNITGS